MEESLTMKHLDMIQAAISRMAGNCFQLKGWTLTLAAALMALAADGSGRWLVLVALVPALCFWGLDAYYLSLERRYRQMHNDVVKRIRGEPSTIAVLTMDTNGYSKGFGGWLAAVFSASVLPLHGAVVAMILLVVLNYDRLQLLFK